MKVDGLAVILAIILLPIIIVVTYYIHLQVDTIATENQYNTKLLNATYDAMSAFELNTANEDLSSVADSMRSIILAANNTFFNTLATNLGYSNASKELIQPYIPAILYTLYDGYYIYAPTQQRAVAKDVKTNDLTDPSSLKTTNGTLMYDGASTSIEVDGKTKTIEKDDNAVKGDILYEKSDGKYTTNPEKAQYDEKYMLKSYVQYSAGYKYPLGSPNPTIDVTINYTLDNYINVTGTIGGIYYTKSGYFIDTSIVSEPKINGVTDADVIKLNENEAENRVLGLKTANMEATGIRAADVSSVKVKGQTITANFKENVSKKLSDIYGVDIPTMADAEMYFEKLKTDSPADTKIKTIEYEMQKCKAVAYYISSYLFSNWVNSKLGNLTARKYTTN